MVNRRSVAEDINLVNTIKHEGKKWRNITALLAARTMDAYKSHAYELKLFDWKEDVENVLLNHLILALNDQNRHLPNYFPDWDTIAHDLPHEPYHCQLRAFLRGWVDENFLPLPAVLHVARPPPALVLPLPALPPPALVLPLPALPPPADPHAADPHDADPHDADPHAVELLNDAAQAALRAADLGSLAKDLANQGASNAAQLAVVAKDLANCVAKVATGVVREAEKARDLANQSANLL